MKGAYVAAEVISVGRRTGIVSSGTEEQAIKRAFWESVTSARSAGGRETASYDFYQIRCRVGRPWGAASRFARGRTRNSLARLVKNAPRCPSRAIGLW